MGNVTIDRTCYIHRYKKGIGTLLFDMSMEWLNEFDDVDDYFIFVSNSNNDALEFYKGKLYRG